MWRGVMGLTRDVESVREAVGLQGVEELGSHTRYDFFVMDKCARKRECWERFEPVPDGCLGVALLVELLRIALLSLLGNHPPDLNGVGDAEMVALLPSTPDRLGRSGQRQRRDLLA